jgi:hypothetical protein
MDGSSRSSAPPGDQAAGSVAAGRHNFPGDPRASFKTTVVGGAMDPGRGSGAAGKPTPTGGGELLLLSGEIAGFGRRAAEPGSTEQLSGDHLLII